eukprot:scaffold4783_cov69-Phaeocystis_antarctica.AAC.3
MLLSRLCSSTSSSMTACAVRPSANGRAVRPSAANGAVGAGTGLDGAAHASPMTKHSAVRCPAAAARTASPRTSPERVRVL